MFLHLGGSTIVRSKDVIAILNAENCPPAQLQKSAPVERPVRNVGGETKAIVITAKIIYLSPISSGTLRKRAEYLSETGG